MADISVIENTGHADYIVRLAISRDNQLVASNDKGGSLRLWQANSGKLLRELHRSTDDTEGPLIARDMTFSPDNSALAILNPAGRIELYDTASGRRLEEIGEASRDTFRAQTTSNGIVAFSPSGSRLVAVANGELLLADASPPASVTITYHEAGNNICGAAWSPNGKFIVTAGAGVIRIRDDTGAVLRRFPIPGNVCAVGISPDGQELLTRDADGTVRVLAVNDGQLLRSFPTDENGWAFAWPDGTLTAFTPNEYYGPLTYSPLPTLYDAESGKIEQNLDPAFSYRLSSSKGGITYDKSLPANDLLDRWEFSADGKSFVASVIEDASQGPGTGLTLRSLDGSQKSIQFGYEPKVRGLRRVSSELLVLSTDADDRQLTLWNPVVGTRTLLGTFDFVDQVAFSSDGATAGAMAEDAHFSGAVYIWNSANGESACVVPLSPFETYDGLTFSSDARHVMIWSFLGSPHASVISLDNCSIESTLTPSRGKVFDAAFSPDARRIALIVGDGNSYAIDILDGTGRIERTVEATDARYVRFGEGDALFASDLAGSIVASWNVETGQPWVDAHLLYANLGATMAPGSGLGLRDLCLSADGRLAVAEVAGQFHVFDPRTGAVISTLPLPRFTFVSSIDMSPSGELIVTLADGTISLWDARTGGLIRQWSAGSPDMSVEFSDGGSSIVGFAANGSIRVWSAKTGIELVTLHPDDEGGGIAMTPAGFFAATEGAAQTVNVVRGLKVFAVDQFFQALYRPDLVAARMKGDPNGVYALAAAGLDLQAILDGGQPPELRLKQKADVDGGTALRIVVDAQDRGGGIGNVEWRVNGVTDGISRGASALIPNGELDRVVKLAPGHNRIEITVYTEFGLLSSEPLVVEAEGPERTGVGTLHILTIGVDDYAEARLKLKYAIADASEFGKRVARAGSGVYDGVDVMAVPEQEATRDGIDRAFSAMAARTSREDTFVLYVAGHGKTISGRYYFFPQDFRFGEGRTIPDMAIGQQLWQDWLARMKAQRSILIFDTCESELVDSLSRSLDQRNTAMDLLRYATGRSVIAAARAAEPAFEGYHGHGLLTFVLLQAFSAADFNGDGLIETDEIAREVRTLVPELALAQYRLQTGSQDDSERPVSDRRCSHSLP